MLHAQKFKDQDLLRNTDLYGAWNSEQRQESELSQPSWERTRWPTRRYLGTRSGSLPASVWEVPIQATKIIWRYSFDQRQEELHPLQKDLQRRPSPPSRHAWQYFKGSPLAAQQDLCEATATPPNNRANPERPLAEIYQIWPRPADEGVKVQTAAPGVPWLPRRLTRAVNETLIPVE